MRSIGSISWPKSAQEACCHYLSYAVRVVEGLDAPFPDALPDPVGSAKRYLRGELSDAEYRSQSEAWWDFIDSSGLVRDFQNHSALTARLALCLLCATPEEAPNLGEHLSWFLEILEMLRLDVHRAEKLAEHHFTWRD